MLVAIDECHSWQPDYVYKRLQSVLRSAARLVLLLPCHASVTSLMRDKLHWLGFPYRIDFKLCLLAHKSLHGQAPQYLAGHCIPVSRGACTTGAAGAAAPAALCVRGQRGGREMPFFCLCSIPFLTLVFQSGRHFTHSRSFRRVLFWSCRYPAMAPAPKG